MECCTIQNSPHCNGWNLNISQIMWSACYWSYNLLKSECLKCWWCYTIGSRDDKVNQGSTVNHVNKCATFHEFPSWLIDLTAWFWKTYTLSDMVSSRRVIKDEFLRYSPVVWRASVCGATSHGDWMERWELHPNNRPLRLSDSHTALPDKKRML